MNGRFFILIGLFFVSSVVLTAEGTIKWSQVGTAPLIPGGVTQHNISEKFLQYQDNILKGLIAAGVSQPQLIFNQLVNGEGVEISLPPGIIFDWMMFDRGQLIGQPVQGRPVEWFGSYGLHGFLIETDVGQFFVTAGCGNIAKLLQRQHLDLRLDLQNNIVPSSSSQIKEEKPALLTPPVSWIATWSQRCCEYSYPYYYGYVYTRYNWTVPSVGYAPHGRTIAPASHAPRGQTIAPVGHVPHGQTIAPVSRGGLTPSGMTINDKKTK